MRTRRPDFTQHVQALISDVASRLPEFSHVRADRILIVAGEARRASRATIKPLTFRGAKSTDRQGRRKPMVRVAGKRMLYCITLRPLFFRASTPQTRVGTLLHELFHISHRFDGTLHEKRRHAEAGKRFDEKLHPLVIRYLELCPEELLRPFAHDGEVWMRQWLERPGVASAPGKMPNRRLYTDAHLFRGIIRMITPTEGKPRRMPRKKKRREPEDPRLH